MSPGPALEICQEERGCTGCKLIIDAFQIVKKFWSQIDPTILSISTWDGKEKERERVSFGASMLAGTGSSYREIVCRVIFNLDAGYISPWPAITYISNKPNILRTPNSEDGFKLVHQWLSRCSQGHLECSGKRYGLLKRVLDFGLIAGGKEIFLYESQLETHPYTALSHCLGPPSEATQPLQTLKGNLQSRKLKIRWQDLNQSFQDSISVTQKLGVRYLWIDSLCIIQDDDDDWLEQSGQMGQIYSGSYLTIAATRAANGADGCFSTRISKEIWPGISVRQRIDHSHWVGSNRSFTDQTASTNPLFSRAWCLQERLLSTRVLHYAEEELIWECNTTTDCECGRIQNLGNFYKRDFQSTFVWNEIVEKYTSTYLTKYTDILPALSGVASS